ncbi:MAG: sigma-70 family RNA polymerase sigma factor [Phycisphaerae bacterium]|nr:sigma-70 family RNA polymerase sigma factor [Phycisphaerae bacterium]
MKNDKEIKQMTIDWTRTVPSVERFVRSFIRESAEAEDVLQEVALVIVDRYSSYDSKKPFIGWALGIARRVVWAHLRKKYRDRDLMLTDAIDQVSNAFERLDPHVQDMKDALAHCVEKVSGEGRKVLLLRYEKGLELKQIASQLGKSANFVGVLLYRVRSALRECIDRRMGTEKV